MSKFQFRQTLAISAATSSDAATQSLHQLTAMSWTSITLITAPRLSTQFAVPQLRTAVSPLDVRRSRKTEEHSTLRAARVELAVVRMESSRNLNEVEGVVGHFSLNDPYIFGTDGYYCGDERTTVPSDFLAFGNIAYTTRFKSLRLHRELYYKNILKSEASLVTTCRPPMPLKAFHRNWDKIERFIPQSPHLASLSFRSDINLLRLDRVKEDTLFSSRIKAFRVHYPYDDDGLGEDSAVLLEIKALEEFEWIVFPELQVDMVQKSHPNLTKLGLILKLFTLRAEDNDGTAETGEVRMVPDNSAHAWGISRTCLLMVCAGKLFVRGEDRTQSFQRKGKSSKMTLNGRRVYWAGLGLER
ncbi:hypothetical protein BC826DRAFT_1180039 [Russula brevipes]|nr:hypothetical protein BC826DRAFT_1180039 [Russula brevipes]